MCAKKLIAAITLALFLLGTFTEMTLACPAIQTQVPMHTNVLKPARLLNTPQEISASRHISPLIYPESCQPNFNSTFRYLDTAGNWHCFGGLGSVDINSDEITHIHAGIYDAAIVTLDTLSTYYSYRLHPGNDFNMYSTHLVRIYLSSYGNAYPEACVGGTFRVNATNGAFCFGSHGAGVIGTGHHSTSTVSSGIYNGLLFNDSNAVSLIVAPQYTYSFPYYSGDLFTA